MLLYLQFCTNHAETLKQLLLIYIYVYGQSLV